VRAQGDVVLSMEGRVYGLRLGLGCCIGGCPDFYMEVRILQIAEDLFGPPWPGIECYAGIRAVRHLGYVDGPGRAGAGIDAHASGIELDSDIFKDAHSAATSSNSTRISKMSVLRNIIKP